jgi:hypothetical protein
VFHVKHDQSLVQEAGLIDIAVLLKETVAELRAELANQKEREIRAGTKSKDLQLLLDQSRYEVETLRRQRDQMRSLHDMTMNQHASSAHAQQQAMLEYQAGAGQLDPYAQPDCTCTPDRARALGAAVEDRGVLRRIRQIRLR